MDVRDITDDEIPIIEPEGDGYWEIYPDRKVWDKEGEEPKEYKKLTNITMAEKWVQITPQNIESTIWNGADENRNFLLQEGDELIGKYIGKKEEVGKNKNTIYNIEAEDGIYGVWGSALLDDRFSHIKEGEKIRIIYKGSTISGKSGREYRLYDVYHQQDDIPVIEE
jgi:hypothetical protein